MTKDFYLYKMNSTDGFKLKDNTSGSVLHGHVRNYCYEILIEIGEIRGKYNS